MTGIESKEEIWDNALTLANNICIQISNRYNDDDEIEKAECANDCAKQIRVGIGQYSEALSSLPVQDSFQNKVGEWLLLCFGEEIAQDKIERNHRFLEESLELVQSIGCTKSEAHQLVDYVFNRPVGDTFQEIGGVMVTLAALCRASGFDMIIEGDKELNRVWQKIDKIREKQANKPKHSPLPSTPSQEGDKAPIDAGRLFDDNADNLNFGIRNMSREKFIEVQLRIPDAGELEKNKADFMEYLDKDLKLLGYEHKEIIEKFTEIFKRRPE